MKEKKIVLWKPDSLMDVNIASAMIYLKVMKIEDMEPMDRVVKLLADMNDVDIEDIKQIPFKDLDEVGVAVLEVFAEKQKVPLSDLRKIEVDGIEYGLEPNFSGMETGAFIDLSELLNNIDENLHKIMAVLYRPIEDSGIGWYELTGYSKENDDIRNLREELFLTKVPYAVVRSAVNFMSSHIEQ